MLRILFVCFISAFIMLSWAVNIPVYGLIPGECLYNSQVDTLGFTATDECFFFTGTVCGSGDTFGSFRPDCAATESIFTYASGDCSGPVEHVVFGSVGSLYVTEDNFTVAISCVYTK